jgi:diguanylate cyclase (GGDEF)-like protein
MELRSLLQVVVTRWWLVVPVFLITVGASLVFALSQKPIYQASAELVVTPAASLPNDILSALGLISRQSEIADTYAQIASSQKIQNAAGDALKLTGTQRGDAKLVSRLLTGTTLLELDATATDPLLARDYANAVSQQLVAYVKSSSGIFQVAVVDEAGVPSRPISPNIPLDVGLGVALGLLLGVGLAVVVHLLNPPPQGGMRDVIDPETWAFNAAFLGYRLRQEMSRARRSHQPVSLALVDVNHQAVLDDLLPRARADALRRIVSLIADHIRPEDVSARMEGTVFAVLLPDTSEEQAVALVEGLRARISAPALGTVGDGTAVHANPAAGVVEHREGTGTDVDVIQQAKTALQLAQAGPVGRTEAFSALRAIGGGAAFAASPSAPTPPAAAPPAAVLAPVPTPLAPTAVASPSTPPTTPAPAAPSPTPFAPAAATHVSTLTAPHVPVAAAPATTVSPSPPVAAAATPTWATRTPPATDPAETVPAPPSATPPPAGHVSTLTAPPTTATPAPPKASAAASPASAEVPWAPAAEAPASTMEAPAATPRSAAPPEPTASLDAAMPAPARSASALSTPAVTPSAVTPPTPTPAVSAKKAPSRAAATSPRPAPSAKKSARLPETAPAPPAPAREATPVASDEMSTPPATVPPAVVPRAARSSTSHRSGEGRGARGKRAGRRAR